MANRRRRILELWNSCSAMELPRETSPVIRELAKHYFFAGAMSAYAITVSNDAANDTKNVLMDLTEEVEAHVQKLEEAGRLLGLKVAKRRV
jgi:hypothetical protein